MDTFVSTSQKEISISHCYSKEKHPQRAEDCVIETFKMPVKLGLTARKHIVTRMLQSWSRKAMKPKKR